LDSSQKSPQCQSSSQGTGVRKSSPRRTEGGYAYVMALAMVLTVIVGSQIVLRDLVTEARSQREADMIWRGNQYARAIKLYYRKTGHFPQSQDDLVTGVPELHFLRSEVIRDPMNKQGGDWRFIYTNSAGAIIGSVKYGSLQQMAVMDMNGGQIPTTTSLTAATSTTPPTSQTPPIDANSAIPPGAAQPPGTTNSATGSMMPQSPVAGTPPGPSPTTGITLSTVGQPATAMLGIQAQPTGPVNGPVFGGQLIGVGSTIDKASVRVYKGGTKYNQWEFIWNPIEEQAQAVQGLVSGNGQQGGPGLGLPGLPLGPMPGQGAPPNPGTNGSGSNGAPGNAPNPTQ
jgi:hypothetical protein